MNGYWQTLRPFEKRVVVGIGALFFVVLNLLFVIPHFSDLANEQWRREVAKGKLEKFQNEIAQTNAYLRGLRELEGEPQDVAPEEQSAQFETVVISQANQSGAHVLSSSPIKTTTNQFFLEKTKSLNAQATETNLVSFLYGLGAGSSQIRVRDLNLRPDQPRQQLVAVMTLIASYQKKAPVKTAAATSPSRGISPRVKSAPPSATSQPPPGKTNTRP